MTTHKNLGVLGFKDIKCLNMALLAIQVWRMIIYPNMFVSKVLRPKYFDKRGI